MSRISLFEKRRHGIGLHLRGGRRNRDYAARHRCREVRLLTVARPPARAPVPSRGTPSPGTRAAAFAPSLVSPSGRESSLALCRSALTPLALSARHRRNPASSLRQTVQEGSLLEETPRLRRRCARRRCRKPLLRRRRFPVFPGWACLLLGLHHRPLRARTAGDYVPAVHHLGGCPGRH